MSNTDRAARWESRKVKSEEDPWEKESLINVLAAHQEMLSVCRDSGKRWFKHGKQQKIDQGLRES